MGYVIMGIIGSTDLLRNERLAGGRAVPLSHGLSLIPLVDADTEPTAIYGSVSEDEMRPGFGNPPPSILPRVAELSMRGAIAFVEAEFFGGEGDQAAVVWRGGCVVLGPLRAFDAINQALRLLGVAREPGRDEFDTVGLGRHRANVDWLSEGSNPS